MKTIVYALLAGLLLLPSFAFAADPPTAPSTTNSSIYSSGLNTGALAAYDSAVPSADITSIIGLLVKALLGLLGLIFLVLIIYAGLLWMTAAGNEDKVKKAQGILKNSIIGLFIIMSAYLLSYFILSNLQIAVA